jgi:hypothetical protein
MYILQSATKQKAMLIFADLILTSGFQKDSGSKNNSITGHNAKIAWLVFTFIFRFAGRHVTTVIFISLLPSHVKTN